jgi:hypothetical protein
MIPKTIAEVTPEWLGDCLGAPVAGLDHTQIGQGVGIMGDIFRVGVRYADAGNPGPASVVIKLPSPFEENRAQGVALGMFEAEVRFYKEFAGEVTVGLPVIFHADIAPGTADFVLIMEDLTDLITVPQAEGMTAGQAHAAMKVLAHVHATWWNRAQTGAMDWIPSMTGDRIAGLEPVLAGLVPSFIDKFGDCLPPGGQAVYEAFAGNYMKIMERLAGNSPWTLVHQDFRVENLLFGAGGSDRVVVLDWQGIGRGPGAYDVAYSLGGSMTSELRRAEESSLLATYHGQLTDLGVTGYSLDALKADYAVSQLTGGMATPILIGGGMDLSNERGTELIATMARRHVQSALDHDAMALLEDILS